MTVGGGMKIKKIICRQCKRQNKITIVVVCYEGGSYLDKDGNIKCGDIESLKVLIEKVKKDEKNGRRPDFFFSCGCIEDQVSAKLVEFEDGSKLENQIDAEETFKKAFIGEKK